MSNYHVRHHNSPYFNAEKFVPIVRRMLAPFLAQDIIIYAHDTGERRPVVEDGNFHIHLWSSSVGRADAVYRLDSVFGLPLSRSWSWFRPSEFSHVLKDPASQTPVAEVVEDNLFIFFPIADERAVEWEGIFMQILQAAIDSGAISLVRDGDLERVARAKIKERFVKFCARRTRKNLKVTTESVNEKRTRITDLRSRLLNELLHLNEARKKARSPVTKLDPQKVGNDFDVILRTNKVKKVVVREERTLEVYTDTILCLDPRSGKMHELGKFKITVDPDHYDVRFINLTRRVDARKRGQHAPHVFDEGMPCLGSAAETFAALFENFEYAAIVMYAVQFLETVNTDDDGGQYINLWPLAQVKTSVVAPSSTAPAVPVAS